MIDIIIYKIVLLSGKIKYCMMNSKWGKKQYTTFCNKTFHWLCHIQATLLNNPVVLLLPALIHVVYTLEESASIYTVHLCFIVIHK